MKCVETNSDSTFPKTFLPAILKSSQEAVLMVIMPSLLKIFLETSLVAMTAAQSQSAFLATFNVGEIG
jgi:hypothetical protein